MTIISERLILRSYTEEDGDALYAILSDPRTMCFWPRPFTREESDEWLRRNLILRRDSFYGRRAVLLRTGGRMRLIGDVGVVPSTINGAKRDDLGYIIHADHWGQGYSTEAAQALLTYCFGIRRLPALFSNMAWDNLASQRVAEHLSMQRIEEFSNPRNRNIRTYVYGITQQTWAGSAAGA